MAKATTTPVSGNEMKTDEALIAALRDSITLLCVTHDPGLRTTVEQYLLLVPTTDPRTAETLIVLGTLLIEAKSTGLAKAILDRARCIMKDSAVYKTTATYANCLYTLARVLRELEAASTEAGTYEAEAAKIIADAAKLRPAATTT